MRPLVLALTLSLTFTLVAPTVSAASCGSVTQTWPEVNGEYAEPRLAGVTHYEVHWWKETNGAPGLQKTSCTRADGSLAPGDTYDTKTDVDFSGLVDVRGGCVVLFGGFLICPI